MPRLLLIGVVLSIGTSAVAAPKKGKSKLDAETAQRVTETLEAALDGRDALAQGRALQALVEMGDKKAKARAKEALAEENWGILRYALVIAGNERKPSKEFKAAMLRVLEDTRSRPQALALLDELPDKQANELRLAALPREKSLRGEILDRLVDRGDKRSLAIVAKGIKHKDKDVRLDSRMRISKLSGKEASSMLMKYATDKDEKLRRASLTALLKSRDPAVVPFLTSQLKKTKDKAARIQLAEALAGRVDRDVVLPVLKTALEDQDTPVRLSALRGIAAVGDRVTAISLRALATDPKQDPEVAKAALGVLGGSGDVSNLDTLRAALATDHLHLRVGAVRAMGALKRREAVPDVARALFDGSHDVREGAAVSLGKIGGPDVVPHLQAAVDRETDPVVRAKIVEALGRSGDPAGVMALQVLLVHNNPELKMGAVEAMLEIGDPAAVDSLVVVVDPRFPKVMEKSIKAICLLEEGQGKVALTAHMPRLSLDFMHELNSEAGPRSVGFLAAFLADGTAPQRALALELLQRRSTKGLAVIHDAAKGNSDAGIRRSALATLARLADRDSRDLFIAGLKDSDAAIKGVSLEALTKLGDKPEEIAELVTIKALMEDRSPAVRVAAAHAVYRLAG